MNAKTKKHIETNIEKTKKKKNIQNIRCKLKKQKKICYWNTKKWWYVIGTENSYESWLNAWVNKIKLKKL